MGGGTKEKKKKKQHNRADSTALGNAAGPSTCASSRARVDTGKRSGAGQKCPGSCRRGGGTRGKRGGKNARQVRKHFDAKGWARPAQGLHTGEARALGSVRDKPTWKIPIGNARDDASNVEVGLWNCFGLSTERMVFSRGDVETWRTEDSRILKQQEVDRGRRSP